ncbi:MAG: hypothetical protein ABIR71_02940 [Chthoniobacterales bacterium]
MSAEPDPPKFQAASFTVQATRGLIRDRGMRRKAISALLVLAVLMVIAGATFLQEALNPREHLGWFVIFWLACGWLTFTALLLALFDLLLVRAETRAARRVLKEQLRAAADLPEDER